MRRVQEPGIIARRDVRFASEEASLSFHSEDISGGVEWTTHNSDHTAILHLGGPISSLESQIDGTQRTLPAAQPGDLWLVPGDHSYISRAKGQSVDYAVLSFPAAHGELLPQMGQFDPFLHACARRIQSAASEGSGQAILLIEQLQAVMETHLLLRYGPDQTRAKEDQDRPHRPGDALTTTEIERLYDFIDTHIDTPIRVGRLARLTGRTSHQFLSACHASLSLAPSQIVMNRRLQRVRELLTTSRLTITEIAAATGFSSHAHLIRAFQKQHRMTPRQYRNSGR